MQIEDLYSLEQESVSILNLVEIDKARNDVCFHPRKLRDR